MCWKRSILNVCRIQDLTNFTPNGGDWSSNLQKKTVFGLNVKSETLERIIQIYGRLCTNLWDSFTVYGWASTQKEVDRRTLCGTWIAIFVLYRYAWQYFVYDVLCIFHAFLVQINCAKHTHAKENVWKLSFSNECLCTFVCVPAHPVAVNFPSLHLNLISINDSFSACQEVAAIALTATLSIPMRELRLLSKLKNYSWFQYT